MRWCGYVMREDIAMLADRKLYKSAYCPMYECYVNLTDVYQRDGEWFYCIHNEAEGIGEATVGTNRVHNSIVREDELEQFSEDSM